MSWSEAIWRGQKDCVHCPLFPEGISVGLKMSAKPEACPSGQNFWTSKRPLSQKDWGPVSIGYLYSALGALVCQALRSGAWQRESIKMVLTSQQTPRRAFNQMSTSQTDALRFANIFWRGAFICTWYPGFYIWCPNFRGCCPGNAT